MNIDAYLARVGLKNRPAPTLEGLRAVHRAHLLSIPYENFDVQMGRKLSTAPAEAYDKIVNRKRGGWCYEMNGVFGWALGELGFKVTRGAGAVVREMKGELSEGNHLVLKVDLPEGIYLADVGFGDGPIEPFPVRVGAIESHGFVYSLARVPESEGWWRLSNHPRGGAPSFDFTLEPADEALLSKKCVMLQTEAYSPFVQNAVVQRHVKDGIMILRGRVLRHVKADGVDERLIADADEFVGMLRDVYALDLPEAATLWPKIVERHEKLFAGKDAQ